MKEKQEYRSFYSRMIDDVDFQNMAGGIFKVLFVLKHSLGAAGIGILRKLMVAEQTGITVQELEAALVELEKPKGYGNRGWIVREKNIVWIVNALANEPNLSPDNPKHITFIEERLLKPLGKAPIVDQFRMYYAAWFGEPKAGPGPSSPRTDTVADRVGHTVPDTVSNDRVSNGNGIGNGIHERRETSDARREPRALEPSDVRVSDTVSGFLDQFYAADPNRRTAVARQLEQSLNSEGARLSRGVRVKAKDRAHLARCCSAVIADPPDDPNVAIVWVLKKLQDEEKDDRGRYPGEAHVDRDKALIAREDAYEHAARVAARQWATEHPEQLADLEARAHNQLPGEGAFHEKARGSWMVQEISQRISFPSFEEWIANREPALA